MGDKCVPFFLTCSPVHEDFVEMLNASDWRKEEQWCTYHHRLRRMIFPAVDALVEIEPSTVLAMEVVVIIQVYERLRENVVQRR